MHIVGVKYEALVSLGNFENEKIGLEARLVPGEDVEEAVDALKVMCFNLLDKADKLERRNSLRREIAQLEGQVSDAREHWNQTAEFLRAQGLRTDAPDFPEFLARKALPPAERIEYLYADPEAEHSDGP